MKAFVCESFGPIDQLKFKEIESPVPQDDEVVIKVSHASVNFPDSLMIQGLYQTKPEFPFSPGHEASGVITKLGKNVSKFKLGQRVMCTPGFGCFAEEVVCSQSKVTPLHDFISMKLGACLTLTYGTSYHALKNCANLKSGERILILGASGGVGSSAIEISKALGACVIAAASSDEKLTICKKLGADHLINYDKEDLKAQIKVITEGNGIDVVYDAVGGKYSETAMRALSWRGRFLVVGFASGEIPKIPLNLALLSERSIIGVFWGDWVRRNPDEHQKNMAHLSEWLIKGLIKPEVSQFFSFSQTIEAIQHLTSRNAIGKVVVQIDPTIG